jgi:FdhE protein
MSHTLSRESTRWHDIRGRLESLAYQYPEWQPSLQLWQAMLYARDDLVWKEAVPQLCPDRPAAAPLLAGTVCYVDARRVGRWVRSLTKLAGQNTAPGQAALLRVNFHQEDVLELLEAALCQEHARLTALAEALGVHPHALAAIAPLAVIPLLQACGQRLASQIPQAWSCGYCPICGAWPTLAETRSLEHTRTLRCARCGAAWGTAWLGCPYCNEMDHNRLVVLLPEPHSALGQIETCATCQGYLKTHTTLQALPAYAVALQDLATMALDVAALDHGYTRPERPGYALACRLVASPARRRTMFGWHA